MNNEKVYESEILAAIHETVSDLYSVELVDESTMKEFDNMCLEPIESVKAEHIQQYENRTELTSIDKLRKISER